ncbi:FtsW/RodA/SpoVE family cell cycle protein [Blattabacterium cuenoti]|uniref:FtsW/RodA/SpoVE family cell cycle protein n=1 Tax=Blattabacterium cuenoti TaxID=1653831 RepID=UPI00163D029E|nr:FtsW/RodA/SpoVE family cell cycle protein [Blattabacterium cuenoti]
MSKTISTFIKKYIKGDKYLWALILLLSLFSFLPVYSANASLLTHINPHHPTHPYNIYVPLFKHAIFLIIGLIILFFTHFIDHKYFYHLSIFLIPLMVFLSWMTLCQGFYRAGVPRWLQIPFTSLSFQTSNLSGLSLLIYCSRILYINRHKPITISNTFFPLLFPIFSVLSFILPANGSTSIIMFISVLCSLFLGRYPFHKLILVLFMGTMISWIYMFVVVKCVGGENHYTIQRIYTWRHRIENFMKAQEDENSQIMQAKSAIFSGKKCGRGPGKSVFKFLLPHIVCDFIYALIIEEYGCSMGILLILVYLLILFRILIISTKANDYFASLLVLSVGFPIVHQAFVNIGVNIGLIPVTGQPLPLISAGGTYLWVTFFSFGIILSVSRMIEERDQMIEKKYKEYKNRKERF